MRNGKVVVWVMAAVVLAAVARQSAGRAEAANGGGATEQHAAQRTTENHADRTVRATQEQHPTQDQSATQGRRAAEISARLVAAANDRVNHPARYDPGYVKIPYPNGDVPADSGVCSDEIIRIYRAVGIDLQKEVHEDMAANRSAYPFRLKWLQVRLDTNIDHRRVPNLAVFFTRKGKPLPVTTNSSDYAPGDIVTWILPSGRDHIGMVVDRKNWRGRYMVEHNIGEGPKIEDVLLEWKVNGHWRYGPDK